MNLKDWRDWGWIDQHPPNATEIRALLEVIERDLNDAKVPQISVDWRFSIAYNAALQSAAAALAAMGYRVKGEGKHMRLIDSLEFTIGIDKRLIGVLQAFRAKRHLGAYEIAGNASETELKEMYALASDLAADLEKWLKKNHPGTLTG